MNNMKHAVKNIVCHHCCQLRTTYPSIRKNIHSPVCPQPVKLAAQHHSEHRLFNARSAVCAWQSSYLSATAWKVPTWYRTKKPRARKGESFQKRMMRLQEKNHISIAPAQSSMSPHTWSLVGLLQVTPWRGGSGCSLHFPSLVCVLFFPWQRSGMLEDPGSLRMHGLAKVQGRL